MTEGQHQEIVKQTYEQLAEHLRQAYEAEKLSYTASRLRDFACHVQRVTSLLDGLSEVEERYVGRTGQAR